MFNVNIHSNFHLIMTKHGINLAIVFYKMPCLSYSSVLKQFRYFIRLKGLYLGKLSQKKKRIANKVYEFSLFLNSTYLY